MIHRTKCSSSTCTCSVEQFLREGVPLLSRLIERGYYLPALRVVANVTPRFFSHRKILVAQTK